MHEIFCEVNFIVKIIFDSSIVQYMFKTKRNLNDKMKKD